MWESNIKSNIFWASETAITSIYYISSHLIIWNISNTKRIPTLASYLRFFMGLANQTLAKLEEAKDIIFILFRVLAVLKVHNSWGMNTP